MAKILNFCGQATCGASSAEICFLHSATQFHQDCICVRAAAASFSVHPIGCSGCIMHSRSVTPLCQWVTSFPCGATASSLFHPFERGNFIFRSLSSPSVRLGFFWSRNDRQCESGAGALSLWKRIYTRLAANGRFIARSENRAGRVLKQRLLLLS